MIAEEELVVEGHWEWCLIPAVVAFAEVAEGLETVCLEAVGVAVALLETAEVLAIAAVPLLVSVAERAAHVVRDVASEGLYEQPPPRPPAVVDGVAAPAEAEAAAEPLLSEPASPFPSPRAFWWEHSDRGSAPARRELPCSRCPPRR